MSIKRAKVSLELQVSDEDTLKITLSHKDQE